jgi:hypothetical protein
MRATVERPLRVLVAMQQDITTDVDVSIRGWPVTNDVYRQCVRPVQFLIIAGVMIGILYFGSYINLLRVMENR